MIEYMSPESLQDRTDRALGPDLSKLPSSLLLRRYTKLPTLIYMLQRRCVRMSDPRMWEDANDRAYLERYRQLEDLKSIFVLCFTTGKAQFHHWKIFAGCPCGVCVRFKPRVLASSFAGIRGISMGKVQYLSRKQVDVLLGSTAAAEKLPFLKRTQFEDEHEYRIVYGDRDKIDLIEVGLKLDSIDSIVLSPWLNADEFASVRSSIRALQGCSGLDVGHSTTLSDKTWMHALRRVERSHSAPAVQSGRNRQKGGT